MPARDIYHDTVKQALIKDGWMVTHDPLRLRWGSRRMYADLGAERFLGVEKGDVRIAVEIKSFIGPSDLAFSMGLPLGHPEVEAAMTEVLRIAREVGVPCGTLCPAAEVGQRLAQGYRFLAVGSDSGLSSAVQEALRAADEAARKAAGQQR